MKQAFLSALFLASAFAAAGESPYLNLGFEDYNPLGGPKIWGANGQSGEATVLRENAPSGDACLQLEVSTEQGYFVVLNNIPAEEYQGKALRISGMIKGEGVTQYATFFARADGAEGNLAFENMSDKWVKGDVDWASYTLEMEIPQETKTLVFGVLLVGTGKAWFDDLSMSVGGETLTQIRPEPVVPKSNHLKWLAGNAVKMDGSEAAALDKAVGNRRLVMMGAGSNGTVEFLEARAKMTRHLIKNKGFSTLALEVDGPVAQKLDAYVKTGKGDIKALLGGSQAMDLNTEEALKVFEAMRNDYASGNGSFSIVGYHAQSPETAVEAVKAFVAKADPEFSEKLNRYYYHNVLEVWKTLNGPYGGALADMDTWRREGELVRDHLVTHRGDYEKKMGKVAVGQALQNARAVLQSADFHGKNISHPWMTDNIAALLDANKDTRMVVWAHNERVRKDGVSMGALLAKKYGEAVLNLGFVFHEGTYTAEGDKGLAAYETLPSEPGCAEWFFKETGMPSLFLNLNKAADHEDAAWLKEELEVRFLGKQADAYAFKKRNLSEMFHTLVYYDKSTATTPLVKPQSEKPGE